MSTFSIKSIFIKIAKFILPNEEDWIIHARRRYANSVMEKKKHNLAQLSEKELDDITRFWHKFHKQATSLFSMQQYAVYKNSIRGG